VEALVGDLSSPSAVTRDGAVARLTVIGARAVQRLLDVARTATASPVARAAAFRALEAIAEPRALATALTATSDPDPAVASAALGVARAFLKDSQGVKILDHVTAIALDRGRDRDVRLAAIRALSELEPDTIQPIATELESDPDSEIANALKPPPRRKSVSQIERLNEAAAGTIGDDPAALRRALARSGHDLSPSALHQIVELVRVREGADSPARKSEWMAVRAAAHIALAHRGSRLGLYDLRDTVGHAREPIAVEFLSAMTAIGESSSLEPIATAYAHAKSGARPDVWWLTHLGETFRAIVARERVTRGHQALKKIEKRWPGLLDELTASKSRPKPKAQSQKSGA